MKFSQLTEEQKDILRDVTLTAKEIQPIIGCGIITVLRWRKKLGVTMKRGSKPDKPRPWQATSTEMKCAQCGSLNLIPPSRQNTFKYCSRSCMYDSEEYINKIRSVDRSYLQHEDVVSKRRRTDVPEYRRYRARVARLTEIVYNDNKDKINPNNYPRAIAGTDGAYHLDHKMSCRYGFDNGISEEVISSADNLQMLPWIENIKKGKKI